MNSELTAERKRILLATSTPEAQAVCACPSPNFTPESKVWAPGGESWGHLCPLRSQQNLSKLPLFSSDRLYWLYKCSLQDWLFSLPPLSVTSTAKMLPTSLSQSSFLSKVLGSPLQDSAVAGDGRLCRQLSLQTLWWTGGAPRKGHWAYKTAGRDKAMDGGEGEAQKGSLIVRDAVTDKSRSSGGLGYVQ